MRSGRTKGPGGARLPVTPGAFSPYRTIGPVTRPGRQREDLPPGRKDGTSPPGRGVRMLICMQSTSVRIDAATHEELKRLAAELHTTVGNTVALAVRALRQDRVGGELSTPLRNDETAWLDADLG